jgi:SecD/SecF fusion protein
MPRAAFSQIVNRSMSEVLTRSLATTSCTLLPIIALLLFGGSTLQDFAFALLIGGASGAYSSIFIASPVLTHWKERESVYRHRRHRIETHYGIVAPYATTATDVEPARDRARRGSGGRLTQSDPENVSAAEFEQMKRDIAEEEAEPAGRSSRLTKRLARKPDAETGDSPRAPRASRASSPAPPAPAPFAQSPPPPPAQKPTPPDSDVDDGSQGLRHAPDEAENDAMSKPRPAKARSRNRPGRR